jgi:hypothetical protein
MAGDPHGVHVFAGESSDRVLMQSASSVGDNFTQCYKVDAYMCVIVTIWYLRPDSLGALASAWI